MRSLFQRRSAIVISSLVIISLVGAAAFAATRSTHAAAQGVSLSFSKQDRALLAQAVVNHEANVSMLFAVTKGTTNATIVSKIQAIGGTVQYQDATARYIRATIPTSNALKVQTILGLDAFGLNDKVKLDNPKPDATSATTAVTPPDGSTPNVNPYLPTSDTGAAQFVAANPTFDGRGVKIAIVDSGVDPTHPALQKAKNKAGQDVRKIIDWKTYTDPVNDPDPTWVTMSVDVTASGSTPTFTYNGVTYTAPYAGKFHLGFFDGTSPDFAGDPAEGADLLGDLEAVYPTNTAPNVFPVLTSKDGYDVWVDTTKNQNFTDEKDMVQYGDNNTYDISYFGESSAFDGVNPRGAIPFVVQTDPKNKLVNIGIVQGDHGTNVAGIASGNGLFADSTHSGFNGAAPNAQIISVRVCLWNGFCSASGEIEGMIYAVRDSGADVVNMSIGGLPLLNDGNDVLSTLYNNLIEEYDVQIFLSAGNEGAGINTVGSPAGATKAVTVGAYVNKATWLSNYGNTMTKTDDMFIFSVRGPRADGGLKPNIVAPGAAISSIPTFHIGGPVPGTYGLPAGIAMFQGTSMAAPEGTGGAALLLSAAKQSGVDSHNAANLRQAITSSTRFIPGYQAVDQGNGLLNVGAAWNLLKTKKIDAYMGISSKASVNTIISSQLVTPNQGPGIYDREGWKAGDSGTRTILFRRDDPQGTGTMKFTITWVGNDGTFSSASTISLPMHTDVPLTVNVHPTTAGVHSALLYLSTPESVGYVYQIINTVIAAEQFTTANGYTVTTAGQTDKGDYARYFYNVPVGTGAVTIQLAGNANSRLRISRFSAYGKPFPDLVNYATGFLTNGTQTSTVQSPVPGVWEFDIESSRVDVSGAVTMPQIQTFTLSVSVLGVTINPASWTVDPTTAGSTNIQSFTATNTLANFTGNFVTTSLGSAESSRQSIATAGAQQTFAFQLPSGATSLTTKIGNASTPKSDLDLYLFYSPTGVSGSFALAAVSGGSTAEEEIDVTAPPAGFYISLVDPFNVPNPPGTTDYDYLDVYHAPSLGSLGLTAPDAPALRTHGISWSATADAVATSAGGTGRYLRGFVQVVSGGLVVGATEIDLKHIS